ncbi:MAG: HEAT repeat domain-containing protein [Verrucomicrobia bacterium]|nr:HEAT repeat domain-containing protein [Verrucomicrobiota bacterium]
MTSSARKLGSVALVALSLCGACFGKEPRYEGRPLGDWLTDLNGPDAAKRQKAVAVIRQAGTNALPLLIEMIQARESPAALSAPVPASTRRVQAVKGFLILGDAARPAIPALTNLLSTSSMPSPVALALSKCGREGVAAVIAALKSDNSRVRAAATEALHVLDGSAKASVPDLLAVLKGADITACIVAARALGSIAESPEIVAPALLAKAEDRDPAVRAAMFTSLGEFGPKAGAAVSALLKFVKDKDAAVRDAACGAVWKIDPARAEKEGVPKPIKTMQMK